MTAAEIYNAIEGAVNDAVDGATSKEEAMQALADVFSKALDPYVKSRHHLKLFIYRVQTMRDLQQQFFAGNRKVLAKSKQEELKVDNAIKKLTSELGYSLEDIKKQFEQQELKM